MNGQRGATRRRPPFPWFGKSQLWITISFIVVIIGSMLPWFDTFLGTRYGLDGWGILALWGGAVGLVGAFSTKKRWFRTLPLIGALFAMGIVAWTLMEGFNTCSASSDGSAPCRPAIGLVVTGAAAMNSVWWGYKATRDV